jgi:transposase
MRKPVHPSAVRPICAHDPLYIGIDVGKQRHVAGFVSPTLLQRHERFEGCPVLLFDNSREGFRRLVERMTEYAPLEQCAVLVEKTGHYHRSLVAYLMDLDVSVYVMHVQRRANRLLKTDKRDALGLANHLLNQLGKGIQFAEPAQLARRALPPSVTASRLKSLVGHRYELVHESTQRKNKLTALCDQLFPELTQIFRDPNAPTALLLREQFPTASAVAQADIDALCALKAGAKRHGRADLLRLQALAAQSIGVKDPEQQAGLIFEQRQLLRELRLLHEHLAQIDAEITSLIAGTREGHILVSLPGIGMTSAAAILAAVGNIDNFPTAASLKSYFGWAPKVTQSGESCDHIVKTRGGERTMKEVMYLVALRAIQQEGPWADLYHRLVQRKCDYDERTQAYRGKNKIIGRIAGQIIAMIYAFLKSEAELRATTARGKALPPPKLYDVTIHKAHQSGQYHASKPELRSNQITHLSP